MFDRILVAVDGSECAKRAAEYGLELGEQCGATVEVVTAVPDRSRDDSRPDGDSEAESRQILDDVTALAADIDASVETRSVSGRPSQAIVDRAAAFEADVVVMGRTGCSGLGERLLGTVTERVLRRTDVPVLAVPDGDLGTDTGAEYGDVLVTTDGSENAEAAAPYAGGLARRLGATLHVLCVVDVQSEAGVFDAGGVSREYVERLEAQAREATERLARRVDGSDGDTGDDADAGGDGDSDTDTDADAGVAVRTAVVRGTTHEGIREYVEENGVDLVVMSSEGQSSLAGQRVGSVAGRVLRTVDVPVLVVPSK